MASGYAPQIEKLAGMGRGEQREFVDGHRIFAGSSKPSSTDRYGSDLATETTLNSNRIDAEQPKGPAEMEAVTVVWTRNWLVLAYSA